MSSGSRSSPPTTAAKGKERAHDDAFVALPADSDSDSSSASDNDDGFGSDWTDDFTAPDRLSSLLQKAKISMEKAARLSRTRVPSGVDGDEEDAARDEELDILLFEDESARDFKLPTLDPGSSLPAPYIEWADGKKSKSSAPVRIRNLDAEKMIASSSAGVRQPVASTSKQKPAPNDDEDDEEWEDADEDDDDEKPVELDIATPAPAQPAYEVDAKGKRVTKRDQRERKTATAGPNWFDLPAPPAAELPKLYREVEAMRLRNQLDPKRFYRKDEGEGKGIKGLPKYFALHMQIGTVVATPAPFGGPSADNLPRAARKRTIVDELVDDAEAKRYAKRKFGEFSGGREAKGRKTLKDKQAKRARKW
ncbi:Fcf2-domain-containing protein [Exidia glandulosa HHB12029]|uniref:Fcf2-domain-containing protein n=1 Tax=Exidia glandulosa HHB12029 TaxID=1314781 RepID=A0A165GXP9_EXIGL|nr:Fcf2-domain-containing protein [Exidia glandulosa HHB12029]